MKTYLDRSRDFVDHEIPTGHFMGGFHTYVGTVLRVLTRDYDCQPEAKWLDGQMARMSRAHDFGESAELCADMVAKFWVGHIKAHRARMASDPMLHATRVVRF